MTVFRIVSHKHRTTDLSGTGSFNVGGRWNDVSTYAVYTSESRALAALELLVHTEISDAPPDLFIITIDINDNAPVYIVATTELPQNWRLPENSAVKNFGSQLLAENMYLALNVPSAVMPYEFNLVLNPLYPAFAALVNITDVPQHAFDERLG